MNQFWSLNWTEQIAYGHYGNVSISYETVYSQMLFLVLRILYQRWTKVSHIDVFYMCIYKYNT